MAADKAEQLRLRIGVDVGGTFTDLIASDGTDLHVVKVPSTPPDFHLAVIEAVRQSRRFGTPTDIIHGSTVATNALLQRAGAPTAFVTTHGFADMLLIGRQDRPSLYALDVQRPRPLTGPENWFTVRERISAQGEVVTPLPEGDVDALVADIKGRGLEHVAVCLLFSFINASHEKLIAARCETAGLSVSLSSEVLPEFREYERASATVINAAMRPVVRDYLQALTPGLAETADGSAAPSLKILNSTGGTLTPGEAQQHAARLVLSGPAGGVMGAAFVAAEAGISDVITYDMGGTSTDVAVIVEGQPQWTTTAAIDGLPVGLPMLDIHTVGAGGGSVAWIDAGGALRVGPRSASARPGPVCYNRGGTEPTVTDANLLLKRIIPDQFLGGAMRVDEKLAHDAIERVARAIGKSVVETALGIIRIAEANMEKAVRAVTSRRGHDPRNFALVSFGGAGGLHACALAQALDIPRVLVPPYCGVLSALGMVIAPPVADASRTVVHLGEALDDNRLIAELGSLSGQTIDVLPYEQTDRVESFADARFVGQSHELKVKLERASMQHVEEQFLAAYRARYGTAPEHRKVEVVTLRLRRFGKAPKLTLPPLRRGGDPSRDWELTGADGRPSSAHVFSRGALPVNQATAGPFLLVDPEATTLVPTGWTALMSDNGLVMLKRAL